jgi:hypothetical protein
MVLNPISLVIGLVVFACVFMLARWAIAELGVPDVPAKIIMVLLVLAFFLWLLGSVGLFGHFATVRVGGIEATIAGYLT